MKQVLIIMLLLTNTAVYADALRDDEYLVNQPHPSDTKPPKPPQTPKTPKSPKPLPKIGGLVGGLVAGFAVDYAIDKINDGLDYALDPDSHTLKRTNPDPESNNLPDCKSGKWSYHLDNKTLVGNPKSVATRVCKHWYGKDYTPDVNIYVNDIGQLAARCDKGGGTMVLQCYVPDEQDKDDKDKDKSKEQDKDDVLVVDETAQDDEQDKDQKEQGKDDNKKEQGKDKLELPDFCIWAKPVCDFIDWFKQEPPAPEKPKTIPKANLSDLGLQDDIDKKRIDFTGTCPTKEMTFTLRGQTIHEAVPMYHLCNLLEKIAPWLVGFTYLSCVIFIVRSV